jgi:hypothetical protein
MMRSESEEYRPLITLVQCVESGEWSWKVVALLEIPAAAAAPALLEMAKVASPAVQKVAV